jgi:hypothetical protein
VINAKIAGMLVAAFVAGSFVASPELRAYAANTVRSIDIVDGQVLTADLGSNAVTAAKIKDGEVKAAEIATNAVGAAEIATNAVGAAEIATGAVGHEEIATDAVGAAELAGVTELEYATCKLPNVQIDEFDSFKSFNCNIEGVDSNDSFIGSLNDSSSCLSITSLKFFTDGQIIVFLKNHCSFSVSTGTQASVALMMFDKTIDSKT